MQGMKSNRRQLLGGALKGGLAAFGLGSGSLSKLARASTPDKPPLHYVFCYFGGGWDVLVSLDPRDPVRFNSGNRRQTLIQPAYEMLQGTNGNLIETRPGVTYGPFIGDLAQHSEKMAVVRGLSMETLAHETGLRRFLTGRVPSGFLARGSAASTWLASRLGRDHAIPNLSVGVESYNVDQPSYATAVGANGVGDLLLALKPGGPAISVGQDQHIDIALAEDAQCSAARRSRTWQTSEATRKKAHEMVAGNLGSKFDFMASSLEMEQLRSRYGIQRNGNLGASEVQLALAGQALVTGISRVVTVRASGGLDTHFTEWATVQGPNQRRGFNAIARLVEHLEGTEYQETGTSWLDHTVIMGFSEFSRTPMLNDRGGRDHWFMNACFLLGAGIKGGVAVGRSSDVGMEPTAINLDTGLPDPGGSVPRPEHVLQSLFVNAGMTNDEADVRVPPLRAIMRPV